MTVAANVLDTLRLGEVPSEAKDVSERRGATDLGTLVEVVGRDPPRQDMRSEFLECGSLEEFKRIHGPNLHNNTPYLLHEGEMAVLLIDVAGSARLGTYAESLQMHRNTLWEEIADTIRPFVDLYHGDHKLKEGDLNSAVLNQDPNYELVDDPMYRGLHVATEVQKALFYQASERIKGKVIEAKCRLRGIELNETVRRQLYKETSAELGDIFGTGKDGHVNVSISIGVGPNSWTITKRRNREDLIVYETDNNGKGADTAGRVKDNNSEISAGYYVPTRRTQGMDTPDESAVRKPDRTLLLATESHQIQTVKGVSFYEFRCGGFRTFEHPTVWGILENAVCLPFIHRARSKVEGIERRVANWEYEHSLDVSPDVSAIQREDIFDHGIAKNTALLAYSLTEFVSYLWNRVDALHEFDNDQYQGLHSMNQDINLFGVDNMLIYALTRDIAHYNVVGKWGFRPHTTRYDKARAERRSRSEVVLATQTFKDYEEEGIEDVKNAHLVQLAEQRYTSYAELKAMETEETRGIAMAKEIVDISDMWIRLNTHRSYRRRYDRQTALGIVKERFADSEALNPFLMFMNEQPLDEKYAPTLAQGFSM